MDKHNTQPTASTSSAVWGILASKRQNNICNQVQAADPVCASKELD